MAWISQWLLKKSKSDIWSANSAKLDNGDHEEESETVNIQREGLSSSQVEVIEMLFSSQIISRAQLMFDIMRKIMAEHMDLSKFANDPKM